ncbi:MULTISPECIES: TRAP transporter substrate-binding protein [Halomonas]|uniref:TRAP transporter substrate-binding protein n=3 Tax=Halomonas TaxID=2745 RepID=A0AAU7KI98_9GAMM|nr:MULTISPECIES: TRAP transporter substrate-binding protein [Halomonas]MBY5942534.1 TRAP transporter substrate-binding protein [Halomonas sp. DP5N14-9]MBY6112459.1 TRAP transporter substrate-binding protein [Halomonas sp. DP1Y21-3]MCJ8287752.1 TRAP transporter substrate-binding protein [Halomonas sp.]MCO7217501.1 TRAP transporter substrate-binding protein [Halomonas sp. OfavH-34-E]NQY72472.1 TRAP transporter substrate-binding protein [Halomonas sp.]|tara:strand:+ start:1116 stop:2099 length:984 start_codon:yes stop_codon:yes gene_type:complete
MFKKTLLTAAIVMAATATAAEAKTFKVGMGDPMDSDQGALAQRFEELVESLSDGEMQVELFPGGQLGSETGMIQDTRIGKLDFALVGVGNLTPYAARLGALTMPYALRSHADAVKATTGPLADRWNTIAEEEAGVHIVSWLYSNFRHLTNSQRPVTTLADVEGLKVRVPQNEIMLASYEAWGASPISMSWPEVFTGLQQGVIDGQDNPYIVNSTMKFHEVQDHLTELHAQYSLQPIVMGVRSYERLSDEERAIIDRAGLEAQLYALQFQLTKASEARAAMEAEGVEVATLEDEDEWIRIAQEEVWPQFYEDIGGQEAFEEMQAALGH